MTLSIAYILSLAFLLLTPLNAAVLKRQDNETLTESGNDVKSADCSRGHFFGPSRPSSTDCAQAALQFPEVVQPGNFHHGGQFPFGLPVVRRYKSCLISVDIPNGQQSQASWAFLRQDMTDLILICSVDVFASGKTAGELLTGQGLQINITVTRDGLRDSGVTAHQQPETFRSIESSGNTTEMTSR